MADAALRPRPGQPMGALRRVDLAALLLPHVVLRGRQRAQPPDLAADARRRARRGDDHDRRCDRSAPRAARRPVWPLRISDAESGKAFLITEQRPFIETLLDSLDRRGFEGGERWVWSFHNYNDAERGGDRASAMRSQLAGRWRGRRAPEGGPLVYATEGGVRLTGVRAPLRPRAVAGAPAGRAGGDARRRDRALRAHPGIGLFTQYTVTADPAYDCGLREADGGARPAFDGVRSRLEPRRPIQGPMMLATLAAATIAGCPLFPSSWSTNERVDTLPVAADSGAIVRSIGLDGSLKADFGSGRWEGGPIGIPYDVVTRRTKRSRVSFDYAGRVRPRPLSDSRRGADRGRPAGRRRSSRAARRPQPLQAVRALRAAQARRSLDGGLGCHLESAHSTAAAIRLDERRRRRAADPAAAGALPGGGARPDQARAADDGVGEPQRVRVPRAPLRLRGRRPGSTAHGRAAAVEGRDRCVRAAHGRRGSSRAR